MPAPIDPKREKEVFEAALGLISTAERAGYLKDAGGDDPAVHARLQALLAAHEGQPQFLAEGDPRDTTTTAIAEIKLTEDAGSVIGRYKLLEKLGEGGFGSVWAAEQREPVKRRVALKIIKLGMDTKQVVARFEAERQALAMMDHPNIAKILDAGMTGDPDRSAGWQPAVPPTGSRQGVASSNAPGPTNAPQAGSAATQQTGSPRYEPELRTGRPFFVMELVKGIPITKYCDHEKLGTQARLDLFIKVCHAIQHAHQKGIIHRDIKPSNIMVTLHDGVPVPKVIDFGIAKATQQELTELTIYTQHHQFIGTPAYMSPEQAEMSGLDIDTRSDIYSLGVLLYELLTGKTPFDAKELMQSGIDEMRRIIREQEPVRPSTRLSQSLVGADPAQRERLKSNDPKTEEVRASSRRLLQELKGDLDWIVMKCLEKDRSRRYDTANGLAADLKRHLNNEPVVARPPSAAYKFQKAFRRNKLVYSAGGAVAAALLAGIAVSTWQTTEATRARDETEQARLAEKTQTLAAQEESRKARTAEALAVTAQAITQHQLYVANMNVAQHSWEQNHVSRVRWLLKETATSTERGFEWYYWQRQVHQELTSLRGHTKPILAVAYSPDGQRIVTGSADKTAKVWDAGTGRELFPLEGEHTAPVQSVTFSPDGRRIVTGSWDSTAIVWDAITGRKLFDLVGHEAAIRSVAYSTNGQRIVTGSEDGTARVWNADTGTPLLTFRGHTNAVWAVAFSPDGQRVVSGGWDQTARIWQAANTNELCTLVGHREVVLSVAFSPDGQSVVTGSWDQRAIVWDATSGQVRHRLRGHGASVFSVGFSPDGRWIVSGGGDQTARIWDAASGEDLRVFKGHGSQIGSVAFSPDGRRIVTGGGALRFSPHGHVDYNNEDDPTAKVWDAGGGMEGVTLEGHTDAVAAVDISADGKLILSGSFDGTARVWDVRSGREVQKVSGSDKAIRAVAFLPDGKRFVTGSYDFTASIWEIASGRELHKLVGHTADIFSVAVSRDGRWIATGSLDKTVKIWDGATGRYSHTFAGHETKVYPVAFSPDSRRIVSADLFGVGKVWDASNGNELLTFQDTRQIWSAAFSRDGRRIVTGSHGLTAKVWDAASGAQPLILKGHTEHIMAAVFSPDGHRIVTASPDQTAKLWDATTGKELLTLKGHGGTVFSVAFSRNGRQIVTGSDDNTIKVWEAASEEDVATWNKEEETGAKTLAPQAIDSP